MVDLISLSIVVPLFNERESLPDLLEQLYLAMQEKELRNLFTEPFCFEIIYYDGQHWEKPIAKWKMLTKV